MASVFEIEISDLFYSQIQEPAVPRQFLKEYILEIYYEGECIEQQSYFDPIIPPLPGEQFYISFENTNYSKEHGNWWLVKKRKHLNLMKALILKL